ncbi:hypothetical protein [Pseudomonas sp.]|uniref:hypothetical protein n=1 Tax=Pseudomonas sp. TaxID=306 RepID=UPI0028A952CF|nr:hypothetical protein [Pseudomonas sp.]
MNTNQHNPNDIEKPAEEGDFSRDPGIENPPGRDQSQSQESEANPDDPDIAGDDASGQPS